MTSRRGGCAGIVAAGGSGHAGALSPDATSRTGKRSSVANATTWRRCEGGSGAPCAHAGRWPALHAKFRISAGFSLDFFGSDGFRRGFIRPDANRPAEQQPYGRTPPTVPTAVPHPHFRGHAPRRRRKIQGTESGVCGMGHSTVSFCEIEIAKGVPQQIPRKIRAIWPFSGDSDCNREEIFREIMKFFSLPSNSYDRGGAHAISAGDAFTPATPDEATRRQRQGGYPQPHRPGVRGPSLRNGRRSGHPSATPPPARTANGQGSGGLRRRARPWRGNIRRASRSGPAPAGSFQPPR